MDQIGTDPWGERDPRRERLFNAPWTIVALCVGLVLLYGLQTLLLSQKTQDFYSVSAAALAAGRWQTLLTSMFLHQSWPHVLLNSVAALAFGPPTARLFGTGPRGALVFFAFYLACGLVAGLGFAASDARDSAVGASGAIAGLFGSAARIIQGRGRIGPIWGQAVIAITLAWTIVNVLLGVLGLTPGAGDVPVAWQAHLAGYAAGLLLIGPFARLAGRNDTAFTQ